jgi:chemotaxis-related protein WspB
VLFLLVQLESECYAIEAGRIAEIVPMVAITPMPQAPAGVAGVFNYRGAPVPVIDLSQVTTGRPARRRLNTRLVLVHYADTSGQQRTLGLVAERATEMVRKDPAEFIRAGIVDAGTRDLGPFAAASRGFVRRIDIDALLPAALRQPLTNPVVAG